MQKAAKISALMVIILLFIAVFGPFLMGIYIQKKYVSMLAFYNSFSGIHVKPIHYKRNWFSSDATIQIEITNPQYFAAFSQLGMDELKVPHDYTMDIHIQHGPFIYTKNIPSHLGVAAIDNMLHETPDIQLFFSQLGGDKHFIQQNNGFISLAGNYFHRLTLSGIHLIYPDNNAYFKMGKVEGYLWLMPSKQNMSGALNIQSIVATVDNDSITLPDLHYQFDIAPSQYDLWLGISALQLSQIVVSIAGDINVELSNVDYQSDANIPNGKLNTGRQLKVGKLFFNGKELGSLDVKASINKINAQALANIFSIYRDITSRGELYQSQLREKIESLLPTIINSGSSIQLKTLNVNTPTGRLQIDGELYWKMNQESIPDEFPDILTAADAGFNIKLSKTFADELIDFYVTSPFINDVGFDLEEEDIDDATDNIYDNMQNNTLLLDFLVSNGQLRETDALDLLELQKKMVDIRDYANQIKKILDEKYVTLVTSYFLYWGYMNVYDSILAFKKMVSDNQDEAKNAMHAKINDWIKQGFITATEEDYIISIKQDQGNVLFNGKSLHR